MTAISGTEGVSGQGSLVSNSNIVKETEDRF